MPVLVEPPVLPEDVPHVDALLYTHIDNDHFNRICLKALEGRYDELHATEYVASVARDEEGIACAHGHAIGETFEVGPVTLTLTPTWHNWQEHMTSEKYKHRHWERKEYCGFWIETPDGTVWLPSDSRPLPEFLEWPEAPDVMLFDFADNGWHIGFAGAVELANQYPDSDLLLIHWGCVDAPEYTPFNGDPVRLEAAVKNPDRVHAVALGEPFEAISTDGPNIQIADEGTYVVEYDTTAGTITVSAAGWGVVGSINGWGETPDVVLREEAGKSYFVQDINHNKLSSFIC